MSTKTLQTPLEVSHFELDKLNMHDTSHDFLYMQALCMANDMEHSHCMLYKQEEETIVVVIDNMRMEEVLAISA